MRTIEALMTTPLFISMIAAAQISLRGRADAEDIVVSGETASAGAPLDPSVGLWVLALLIVSGAILIGFEMRAEARDRIDRERL